MTCRPYLQNGDQQSGGKAINENQLLKSCTVTKEAVMLFRCIKKGIQVEDKTESHLCIQQCTKEHDIHFGICVFSMFFKIMCRSISKAFFFPSPKQNTAKRCIKTFGQF